MDRDVVERARSGDQEAFADLVHQVSDSLLGVARRILRDPTLAEDVLQNTLLTIWRKLPHLRDTDHFEGWAFRILVHACYDDAPRNRRWSSTIRVLPMELASAGDDIQGVSDRDELERAFRGLPIDHRAVFRPASLRGPASRGGSRNPRNPGRNRSLTPSLRDAGASRCLRGGRKVRFATQTGTTRMMSSDRDFERTATDWINDGSDSTPQYVIDAVLLAVRRTPQERDFRSAPRTQITKYALYAAAIVAVAVGVAAAYALGSASNVGSGPGITASPASPAIPDPSPTASSQGATISPWIAAESRLYGFAFSLPPDWSIRPADHAWTLATDASNPLSTGQDVICPRSLDDMRVGLWSVPVDRSATPETTAGVAAWIETYCEAAGTPCPDVETRAIPLCIEVWDCHPGLLVPFGDDAQAFLTGGIFGENIVVVAVYWGDSGSAVVGYGDARQFLEGFLTTMDVWTTDGAIDQQNPDPEFRGGG